MLPEDILITVPVFDDIVGEFSKYDLLLPHTYIPINLRKYRDIFLHDIQQAKFFIGKKRVIKALFGEHGWL